MSHKISTSLFFFAHFFLKAQIRVPIIPVNIPGRQKRNIIVITTASLMYSVFFTNNAVVARKEVVFKRFSSLNKERK